MTTETQVDLLIGARVETYKRTTAISERLPAKITGFIWMPQDAGYNPILTANVLFEDGTIANRFLNSLKAL